MFFIFFFMQTDKLYNINVNLFISEHLYLCKSWQSSLPNVFNLKEGGFIFF